MLHHDLTTWLLFGTALFLWGASIVLIRTYSPNSKWNLRSIPLTLFSLVWLSFGIDFILRFLVNTYNPELFQATELCFIYLPEKYFSISWMVLNIFWLSFCIAYLIIIKFMGENSTNKISLYSLKMWADSLKRLIKYVNE